MITCPNCHECTFHRGVCERVANRGRRYFLMGALALPVSRGIERVAALVKPKYEAPTLTPLGNLSTLTFRANGHEQTWMWDDDGIKTAGEVMLAHFAMAI